jgi:hypothetical protein
MPERLTLIKYPVYPSGISLITYFLAVQLPLLKGQHRRTGRIKLQPGVNNSLTLNLIVCRKRQQNPGRISLLKRKAQHRRKRIQRKKHGKVKTQRARFTVPGFFLPMRASGSGPAVWFRCTYLPNPAPFHSELPPGNSDPHQDKTAQRNTNTLLRQM